MRDSSLSRLLDEGLGQLSITLTSLQREQLLAYLDLLVRWNAKFNLTAVRDPAAMVTRHLLDSLAILPHVPRERCIDVGTGGGLPGIPLAIARPDCDITLLDSNGKKTRFLTQVKTSLALKNVTVVHARVEAFEPPERFPVVLSRAFASLSDMIDGCQLLVAEQGEFLAMKGQYPEEELQVVRDRLTSLDVAELHVPGLEEARCLVRCALESGQ